MLNRRHLIFATLVLAIVVPVARATSISLVPNFSRTLPVNTAGGGLTINTAGGGLTTDPTFQEDIPYTLGGTVFAGDVVLCEAGTSCNLSTPSTWSDVLVFYNSAKGPFAADCTQDANTAIVFSDDNGTLAAFLAASNGLSCNATTVTENPTGLTDYAGYFVNSPEGGGTVPEPGSSTLLCSGLLGMVGVLRRKLLT